MKVKYYLPLALLALSTNVFAGDFYVSGEVTHSVTPLDKNHFDTLTGATSSSSDDQSNQFRLQAGYQFNPNFAIEAGYIDLGKAKYKATAGSSTKGELKAGGIDLVGLAILPVTDDLSLFAKGGFVAASVDAKATGFKKTSTNEIVPLVGVGAIYKIDKNIDLRADYDYAANIGSSNKTGEIDSHMLSMGVTYHF